jgi:hypothetical protein
MKYKIENPLNTSPLTEKWFGVLLSNGYIG